MLFFETSAKLHKNIDQVFTTSVNEIDNKINQNFYDLTNDVNLF